jgi:hypothetical protein
VHNLHVSTTYRIGETLFLILGLCCFLYAWFLLLKRSTEPSVTWRERISLAAMIVASIALCLRFVMPAFIPAADWGTGAGVGAQVHAAAVWTKVGARSATVALLLGLIGRPRLIAPIAVACLSIVLFWVMSTVP